MKKNKKYFSTRFPAEVFPEIRKEICSEFGNRPEFKEDFRTLTITLNDDKWDHDTLEEFLSDYRASNGSCHVWHQVWYLDAERKINGLDLELSFSQVTSISEIGIRASERRIVEKMFEVFERHREKGRILQPETPARRPVIFIGHGHGEAWRDLKDHLHDLHGYEIEAYETGARAGHTIRDILNDMASKSSFALLVLTGDDFADAERQRARQNVVHETGLFQGRLGFERAIVLLEDGVEEFSNLHGIQQIRFEKGNIRATFGDVLAILKREFG